MEGEATISSMFQHCESSRSFALVFTYVDNSMAAPAPRRRPTHVCADDGLRSVPSRVTWGKAPPFGDDLSLTYLFASTSEKSYSYVTNYMLCV